ncbi:MAG: serine hydroxymethyltransferase [Candidatus Pacebacteria bacterium]|jgi:glycine hydroxymethyltransferase|nr:serine hydroxymethyltransferase [Candidatus Paceibacterota bacterium]|tara:strand:- start:20538 stop:21812 length:1275 start_codon:yes stop_codon:yes gene_type:complete
MEHVDLNFIKKEDGEIYDAIFSEEKRQTETINLIPSENYVSRAVREASGSVLTNKYSEGYPGKRYYSGQEFADSVERIAIERATKLFGCKYANVQALSGDPANIAAYFALAKPGDTILAMDLSHGGHLTHGHPGFSLSKIYRFVHYKMKNIDTGEIDYNELRSLALEHKPKIIVAGFSAYTRELDYEKFVSIAKEIKAYTMVDIAHIAGLIAGKAFPNPFDANFDIITATTHKSLRGPRGGLILIHESKELAEKIDRAIFPGIQGGPHMNMIAAKAICFKEALQPAFAEYAKQVLKNAKVMEKVLKKRNIRMIAGGTSNHMILADVYDSLGITGKVAQELLESVDLTVNQNLIADDKRSAKDPSGIRFGSPAVTTRGFKEKECEIITNLMIDTLENKDDESRKQKIINEVQELSKKFPIPDILI